MHWRFSGVIDVRLIGYGHTLTDAMRCCIMNPNMATICDVAKRARVSTYTVSVVLNQSANASPELTRRVLKAVRELNYTIDDGARSLRTRKTRTIGMLIPDIASPFYAKVVRGAEDVLKEAGYSLILGSTYNDANEQSRYIGLFRSKQVDGVMLFVAPGDAEDLRDLVAARKPVVFVGREPVGFEADAVVPDYVTGTRRAVDRLIAKGHQRIGIITGHLPLTSSSERITGWRRALKKAGYPEDRHLIGEGDWTAESGYRVTLSLLDLKQPPTAIFTSNFLMMTGALRALKERGLRHPQDVEVMSSDDSEWLDVFEPRISTVVQPSYVMGQQAAELLLKRFEDPDRRFEKIVLPAELKLRN